MANKISRNHKVPGPRTEVLAQKKAPKEIDKKFTTMKTAEAGGSLGDSVFTPNDDQLTRINQFTRSEKSAEDVICFNTLSCNDILDRDLDRFTTQCVKDFAKLPGNRSPIGKSYMVGHDYTNLPVGRIFGADTKSVNSNLFLTNEVYIPNTDANKSFIENVDYGIYWAVSVGVMLGESECAVCAAPFSGWGYWCMNGHDKGLYYDPNSDEEDSWGWPLPVEEGTKGAILCTQELFAPTDFYELSQVFLGAQYYAELEKKPSFSGIMKAASKRPIVNLAAKEARELPLPEANERVAEARKKYSVDTAADGSFTWTDENNLVWVFDPDEDAEVMCLGTKKESEDDDGEESRELDGQGGGSGEESLDRTASGESSAVGVELVNGVGAAGGDSTEGNEGSSASVEDSGEVENNVTENDKEGEEKAMSKKQILAAATKAKVPEDILGIASEKAGDDEVLTALLEKLVTRSAGLEEKAELGDQYVKSLKAEALSWYVKNRQAGEVKGIKTKNFEKVLDRIGNDPELLKEVIEEQADLARAKFPNTRRSVENADPNERAEVNEFELDKDAEERVRSFHS